MLKDWEAWENEVADRLDGCTVRCSGRLPTAKGDARASDYLIDAKHTTMRFYSLHKSLWADLEEWARNEGRIPCVAVRCPDADIAVIPELRYAEMHPEYEAVDDLPTSSSKSLHGGRAFPLAFRLGHARLVAYLFEDFEGDVIR